MFFTASKVFWFVAEPVSLAVAAGVLAILLGFTRFARAGRALIAGAMIALAAELLTPLGAVLLRPLEDRFPRPTVDIPAPAGIIVLGGAFDTEKSEARGQVCLTLDAARMTTGVELARR
ncbi:MAG: YdcF family protein, partial [Methylocella sp.]